MAQSSGQAVLITSAFSPVRSESTEAATRSEFDLKNFEKLPARDVPVSALSPGVSLRQSGTDAAHIQLLVDAAGSAELPPILVQMDGYRIIDGLHRLEAARLRGDVSIKARFLDCSNSEALVIAMKANGSHGLPLSKADRVSGAQRVLSSHPDWSDRAIAGITGLSAKTIASLRDRTSEGAPLDGKRIGRDGRRRPVDAGEGRRRAAEYITAHPNAPLRQVARETDVSLGTVHDVSARLRRGDSPERDGRQTQAARPEPVQPVRSVQSVRPVQAVPAVQSVPTVRQQVRLPGEAARPAGAAACGTARGPLRVAPHPDAAPAPRRNHTEAPPAWATVAAKMATDPAIRYNAGGREFLRWMQLHATDPDEDWRELVDAVPPHWLGVIAPIAERISREWSLLAEQLKTKQDMVP
ncbi:ParB N-terminal domain-containing protein [Streptomyces wedmorensis]|uniref:Nuclease n=1 Tax=Streptomyces viridochromogenes TaxID=1938 RepID=A0A0L8KJT4_STRVR|nr:MULTISPECIES: ParB N-terminal domain-containing protein [Streptomyces]KOG26218.1 nuclease [Streptomyces viridochromogenes]